MSEYFNNVWDYRYLAGVLDYRGHFCKERGMILVSVRLPGKLPGELKRKFGGTCFVHDTPKRNWYKVRGQKAEKLLLAVLPYLIRQAALAERLLAGERQ